MPIPTEGEWPPQHVADAYKAYRDWDAWYSGNPDKLRHVYAGRGTADARLRPSQRTYPGQYAGGVIGRFSRWLWGAPPPANQRDGRLHAPLPSDLAAMRANMLLAEPPTLSHEQKDAQKFLDRLIEDGLVTQLLHAAEAGSALGDVYLRPVVDTDIVADRAIPTYVHADGAIPTIRWGKLTEVTFWQCLHDDGHVYVRLLEHHDVVSGAGRITYALYEGTSDKLGKRIDLGAYPESAYLLPGVDRDGMQATGLDRLDVVRIPNAGPQRLWRTRPALKYLGRSDFDGVETWFDALDEVWTSWLRDIRLAKARLLVPDYMLRSNGPGEGATFDPDQEIYRQINVMPDPKHAGGAGITPAQFEIRVAEHRETAEEIAKLVLRHDGFSPSTFGDDGQGMPATATEIQAKQQMTFVTRGNTIQTWRPGIADYVELHMAVEAARFNARVAPVRPNVEFADSVSEAPQVVAQTIQLLDAARAISTELKVRMAHPDWRDPEVQQEVDRIKQEAQEAAAAAAVEDPETFTGVSKPGATAGATSGGGAAARQADVDLGLFGV